MEQSKKEEKEYFIDFGSWYALAKSPEEAKKQAMQRLRKGEVPPIDTIDEV